MAIVFLFLVGLSTAGLPGVMSQEEEPNVGLLRIADVKHPRQVAPSAKISFAVDVEYAIRFNATVRSSLFEGAKGNLGSELWHSDPTLVSGGGDQIWPVNLTAPASEQEWTLTAFAYYLEDGQWKYYNDTDQGPGFAQTKVKIAPLATLEIDVGVPEATIDVDGAAQKTMASGNIKMQLPVGTNHQISVDSTLLLKNSTRLLFAGWDDGLSTPQRTVLLDGDTILKVLYKTQYLLIVNSIVPAYSYTSWYDAGSNVTLSTNAIVPATGILGALGIKYAFNGWSGDVASKALTINVTLNRPKTINADFTADYAPLVIPSILAAGILAGFIVAVFRVRGRAETEPAPLEQESGAQAPGGMYCNNCGQQVEESWTNCTHCGKPLRPSDEPVEN